MKEGILSHYRVDYVMNGFPGYWCGYCYSRNEAIAKSGIEFSLIMDVYIIL
jgi:hypothetical protein